MHLRDGWRGFFVGDALTPDAFTDAARHTAEMIFAKFPFVLVRHAVIAMVAPQLYSGVGADEQFRLFLLAPVHPHLHGFV